MKSSPALDEPSYPPYRLAALAFACLLISGVPSQAEQALPSVQLQRLDQPAIGVLSSREVGDPILVAETALKYPAIVFAPGAQIKNSVATFTPDGPFILSPEKRGKYCGTLRQVRAAFGAADKLVPGACLTRDAIGRMGLPYTETEVVVPIPQNLRQELIYEGRSKDELRLSYREFSGDFARPAFTQDLTFELKDDNVVGAKGARIKVLSATNIEISYRVLKSFK